MMKERDFMGLSGSKEPVVLLKENHNDNDSGLTRSAGVHWIFSNKVPAHPIQHDLQSVRRPYGVKMLSVPNQGINVPMNPSYLRNHFASLSQNFPVTTTKKSRFGGIPVAAAYSAPSSPGFNLRTNTNPRVNVNKSGSPSQMTIFYDGCVNVYSGISPEKAQAMMVLAQNGSSAPSNGAHLKSEAPIVKIPSKDSVRLNKTTNTPPSAFPSSLPVSSHIGTQSVSGSTSTDETMAAKTAGLPAAPVSTMGPPRTAVKPVAATAMNHSGIPQARNASLARFLGKRKERVINAAPYNLNKNSPEGSKSEFTGTDSTRTRGEQK